MQLLIVYGTTEGHTRKVAEHMADYAKGLGHVAAALDSSSLTSFLDSSWFDAIIVGGPVHQGHHQSGLREFVLSNKDLLEQLSSAFFSLAPSSQ